MRRTGKMSCANIFASILMLSQLLLVFFIVSFNDELTEAFPAVTSVPGLLVANEVVAVLIPSLIFSLVICRANREKMSDFLRVKPLSGKNIILIVLMSLCIQPSMGALNLISQLMFYDGAASSLASLTSGMSYLQMVLVVAVVPALFEELALRGAILGAYGQELDTRRTILINGLFFGMIHLNTQQLLYAIALGALFAFFVIRTGSIFAGIIAHFTVNLTQVTLLNALSGVMEGGESYYEGMNTDMPLEDALAIGGALFLSIVFFTVLVALTTFAFMKLLARFNAQNPEETAYLSDMDCGGDEETALFSDTDCGGDTTKDFAEASCAPPPEIEAFTAALRNKSRLCASFNASLLSALVTYMTFMAVSGVSPLQLILLLCVFAAFFFVLFLFRIRG